MRQKVEFMYATGLSERLFARAALVASFTPDGRHTEGNWSHVEMEEVRGPDGCPAFVATVELEADTPDRAFEWGVELDGPAGRGVWGIITEENDVGSTRCVRTFNFGAPPASAAPAANGAERHEVYYLCHARRLGAQKYYERGSEEPDIRFSVWAPNAQKVEVYVGALWEAQANPGGQALMVDPKLGMRSVPRSSIRGGYITDAPANQAPAGAHPQWGPFQMTRSPDGVWQTIPDPALSNFKRFNHVPYMFRVVRDDGAAVFRTDLYSRCQIGFGIQRPNGAFSGDPKELDGVVSCSVVVDPDRVTRHFHEPVWPEKEWVSQGEFFAAPQPAAELAGLTPRDLVIYELHIGALGFGTRADDEAGTLEDALKLLDHLQELGVNTLELLPLSEFGGTSAGWGYATSHYFAIEYSGGGRDQYKWLIRECHKRGIAVILDVVYNHFNHNAERAEWLFDSAAHDKSPYYWYEGRPQDYAEFDSQVLPEARGQGGYLDNVSTAFAPRYSEEMVRSMFISSALALAVEFKVDGLRVDQTTSIRSYNALHANGRPVPRANAFGAKFLRELTRALRLVKPNIILIAEDHENWSGVTEPPDRGGLGFNAAWYADFYHHLIGDTNKGSDYAKLIKTAGYGDDRPLAMDYFAGALQATQGGTKVVYHESHDEAGNGELTDRTLNVAVNGAALTSDTRSFAEARCRFAAGVTFLSAGIPMFLFGEEVGSEKKFIYGHVLENRENLRDLRQGSGSRLFEFYRSLIRLRHSSPALRSPDIDVVYVHNANRILAFRRWGGGQHILVVASLNNRAFADFPYALNSERIPNGRWTEVFNSDAAEFGGGGVNNSGTILTSANGQLTCRIPANGLLVLLESSP